MARRNKIGVKDSNRRRVKQRFNGSEESDDEYKVTEDEDFDESDENYSLDGDESEEIFPEFEESKKVARSRNTRRASLGRKGETIMPRKKRRVCYTIEEDENDDDDDDDEEEEEEVDEEDDTEFVSLGSKVNHIKKPREKKRVSYREVDDEEEEDYAEFVSLGRKRNLRKKPQENNRILHTDEDEDAAATDDDEDDEEFMYAGRKANQKKRLWEKRKVSYMEDDEEDDSVFISTSRKENQLNEPREKRIVSYKEDHEEEEDEKDEEFRLSESDFVDDEDEDESPTMKKNEKVSRRHPLKKSVRRGQKKSKKSKVKRPTSLRQRSHRFGQKPRSKQRTITNKKQARTQSKKISKRWKPRVTVSSDSDFISSASSDHEYTISEEEREQMREASVLCANLRAKLHGKQEEEMVHGQRKYPVRKGKEKVEDMKDELGKQVCGICLSEEGKRTVRGVLNCCRHHFCFSCIMAWSKVESRCPICKQRFVTITKAAKSDTGFDSRTIVIPVPECDQVYQPSEEELRGYLDPYENVVCMECHNGGEDALMLLCDICDSPAHTFCVGLGREVPEGNWYCEGCRPTVFGSQNSQHLTPTSDRRLSSNVSDQSSPIARGFDLNGLYVPETPLSQQNRFLPENRLPVGDSMPSPTGTVATTLRDRRRIHRQIHHRLLNNNGMSELVSRSSGTSSSSGIRLFGSQLDQPRDSTLQRASHHHDLFNGRADESMHSLHDNTSLLSPRVDQISGRVQNSNLASVDVSLQGENDGSGMTFGSRLGYAQLHPCTTNRSTMGSDASPSPYACREVIEPSRTSQGGLHAPY